MLMATEHGTTCLPAAAVSGCMAGPAETLLATKTVHSSMHVRRTLRALDPPLPLLRRRHPLLASCKSRCRSLSLPRGRPSSSEVVALLRPALTSSSSSSSSNTHLTLTLTRTRIYNIYLTWTVPRSLQPLCIPPCEPPARRVWDRSAHWIKRGSKGDPLRCPLHYNTRQQWQLLRLKLPRTISSKAQRQRAQAWRISSQRNRRKRQLEARSKEWKKKRRRVGVASLTTPPRLLSEQRCPPWPLVSLSLPSPLQPPLSVAKRLSVLPLLPPPLLRQPWVAPPISSPTTLHLYCVAPRTSTSVAVPNWKERASWPTRTRRSIRASVPVVPSYRGRRMH